MSVLNFDDTPTQKESPQEGDSTPKSVEDQGPQIVIDGPLSNIYTKALLMTYGKVAQESQANDAIMTMAEYLQNKKNESGVSNPETHRSDPSVHYVYVTSQDHLEREDDNTESTLRLALDSKKPKSMTVVMETSNKLGDKLVKIDNYLANEGVKVYYHRKFAMEQIKRIIHANR